MSVKSIKMLADSLDQSLLYYFSPKDYTTRSGLDAFETLGKHIISHHLSDEENIKQELWRKARRSFDPSGPLLIKGNFSEEFYNREAKKDEDKLKNIVPLVKECIIQNAEIIDEKMDKGFMGNEIITISFNKPIGNGYVQVGPERDDIEPCVDTKLTMVIREGKRDTLNPFEIVSVYPSIDEQERNRIKTIIADRQIDIIKNHEMKTQDRDDNIKMILDSLGEVPNDNVEIGSPYIVNSKIMSSINKFAQYDASKEKAQEIYDNIIFESKIMDKKLTWTDILSGIPEAYQSEKMIMEVARKDGLNLINEIEEGKIDYNEYVTTNVWVVAFESAYKQLMSEYSEDEANKKFEDLVNEVYENGDIEEEVEIASKTIEIKDYIAQYIVDKDSLPSVENNEQNIKEEEEEVAL
jgi:hypothetical protein